MKPLINFLNAKENQGILDFTSSCWQFFDIEFGGNNTKTSLREKRKQLNDSIRIEGKPSSVNGIYAIMKEDDLLYIGKGKPVNDRLYSHYKASLGLDSNERWNKFFTNHAGKLKIYWTVVDDHNNPFDELHRKTLEQYLIIHHKPLFDYPNLGNGVKAFT